MVETIGIIGAAAVSSLFLSRIAAVVWNEVRRLLYERHEKKYRPKDLGLPKLPFFQLGFVEEREKLRKSASDMLQTLLNEAKRLQDLYHACIATGVSAMFLGFVALSVTVTMTITSEWVAFLTAMDVACFTLAFASFWMASGYCDRWVRARAKAELLRQWCTIENILFDPPPEKDVTTRFMARAKEVDVLLSRPPRGKRQPRPQTESKAQTRQRKRSQRDFASRIYSDWQTRRSALSIALKSAPISSVQLAVHFEKRPKSQAHWFDRSCYRLREQSHWRAYALLVTFAAAAALALVKSLIAFHVTPAEFDSAKPGISLAILLLVGTSSMLTALYLNQNIRSLLHRYTSQLRHIEIWLPKYFALIESLPRSESSPLSQHLLDPVVDHLLTFEDLMIEELVDWTSISQEDVMELAAS